MVLHMDPAIRSPQTSFDLKLAKQCASSFYTATGLGCTVADCTGRVYSEYGFGCASCNICQLLGRDSDECVTSGLYGMKSAIRFGGKYVYFCPIGLSCFVSPIAGVDSFDAKITVGPFLMVHPEDFIAYELRVLLHADDTMCKAVRGALFQLSYVLTEKVEALSSMLFMTVSFINDVAHTNKMLEIQYEDQLQGQIAQHIQRIKQYDNRPLYPFAIERELLRSIQSADKSRSQELLNQLLGHIFLASGSDLDVIKSRTYELLVLISRAAINGGADTEHSFLLNHMYLRELQLIDNIDQLCYWLNSVIESFMESTFEFRSSKHRDIICKSSIYMQQHCTEKITLEDVAKHVYLSPNYFCKVFKDEMGESFSVHLNRLRMERSKLLLEDRSLKLTQISALLGYDDQSYFTKIFKKYVGVPPKEYRKKDDRTEI
ncbi:MAG: AraC family transcriptional regulator [Clostridia bacterium]